MPLLKELCFRLDYSWFPQSVQVLDRAFVSIQKSPNATMTILMYDPVADEWQELAFKTPINMTMPPAMIYAPELKHHCQPTVSHNMF